MFNPNYRFGVFFIGVAFISPTKAAPPFNAKLDNDRMHPDVTNITQSYYCNGRRFGVSFQIDTTDTDGKKQNVILLRATEGTRNVAAADISAANEKLKVLWSIGSLIMFCHRDNSSAEYSVEGLTVSTSQKGPDPERSTVWLELPRSTPSHN